MTAHLGLTYTEERTTKGYEIARDVREHPTTWPERYPALLQRLQLIGLGAYGISVLGLLTLILSWLTEGVLR